MAITPAAVPRAKLGPPSAERAGTEPDDKAKVCQAKHRAARPIGGSTVLRRSILRPTCAGRSRRARRGIQSSCCESPTSRPAPSSVAHRRRPKCTPPPRGAPRQSEIALCKVNMPARFGFARRAPGSPAPHRPLKIGCSRYDCSGPRRRARVRRLRQPRAERARFGERDIHHGLGIGLVSLQHAASRFPPPHCGICSPSPSGTPRNRCGARLPDCKKRLRAGYGRESHAEAIFKERAGRCGFDRRDGLEADHPRPGRRRHGRRQRRLGHRAQRFRRSLRRAIPRQSAAPNEHHGRDHDQTDANRGEDFPAAQRIRLGLLLRLRRRLSDVGRRPGGTTRDQGVEDSGSLPWLAARRGFHRRAPAKNPPRSGTREGPRRAKARGGGWY